MDKTRAARSVPVLRLDELPMADDRTAAYRLLREAGPVIRTRYGALLLVDRAAVEFALRHPGLFSSRAAFAVGSPLPLVPIAFDPPEHTRYRRILHPFFSPRGTAVWLPQVRALAGQLIGHFAGRGECDLVTELAVPLPAQVFLTLFGLPLADRDRLLAWKEGLLSLQADPSGETWTERGIRLGAELYEYLVAHIAQRRRDGDTAGLLGQLLADTSAERLTDEEIYGLSFLFVLAGLETVTSALSTAFAALAGQPELRRQLAADPALIPGAVTELLRFDGPVVFVPRVATQDVELAGHHIPAGCTVNICLAVADRDPAGHRDPDVIEFGRQEHSLAFGAGPHRCLGSHLARMQLRVALEEWHRRIPEYTLAPGTVPRAGWPAGLVGIDHLPLVFPRAASGQRGSGPAAARWPGDAEPSGRSQVGTG